MQHSAVVRGIATSGAVFFWTGKAGEGWISAVKADAFTALNVEGARRKAEAFNRFTSIHGMTFEAVPVGGAQ